MTAAGHSPGSGCSSCAATAAWPATPRWRARTLFLKFNTGPSGHGMPPAAGEALALKLAGAEEVKVFVVEGEGGLTPGAQPRDAPHGVGPGPVQPRFPGRLERLRHRRRGRCRTSSTATRQTWFASYGWRVTGTEQGSEWQLGDAGGAGGGARREPGQRAVDGLVQDAQGPRLRQVRRSQPRHALPHERARVLGRPQGIHGQVRRRVRRGGRAGAGRSRRARCTGARQPRDRLYCPAPRRCSRRLADATGCVEIAGHRSR